MVYGSKNICNLSAKNGKFTDRDVRHERYVKKYDKEMKERKEIVFRELYPDEPPQDWEIEKQKINEDIVAFYQNFDNPSEPIKG